MSFQLKPCLLCDSEDVHATYGLVNKCSWVGILRWIECRGCGARSGQYEKLIDAVEIWNRKVRSI